MDPRHKAKDDMRGGVSKDDMGGLVPRVQCVRSRVTLGLVPRVQGGAFIDPAQRDIKPRAGSGLSDGSSA
jgi:hypothetical protein